MQEDERDLRSAFYSRLKLYHMQDVKFGKDGDPAKHWARADVLRCLMSQTEFAQAANILTPEASWRVLLDQGDIYSRLLDTPTEQQGLNNYADAAVSMNSGCRNESAMFKSSLNLDMDSLQAAFKHTQCDSDLVVRNKKIRQSSIICTSGFEPSNTAVVSQCRTVETSEVPLSKVMSGSYQLDPFPSSSTCNKLTAGGPITVSENQSILTPLCALSTNTAPSVTNELNRFSDFGLQRNSDYAASLGFDDRHGGKRRGFGTLANNETQKNKVFQMQDPMNGESRTRICAAPQTVSMTRSDFCSDQRVVITSQADHYDDDNDGWSRTSKAPDFRSARDELEISKQKRNGRGVQDGDTDRYGRQRAAPSSPPLLAAKYGTGKKCLGARRGVTSRFVPPVLGRDDDDSVSAGPPKYTATNTSAAAATTNESPVDPRYKNLEPRMIELIMSEIMDHGPPVSWDQIAGLEFVKKTIKEIVIWPMLRPDIFTGLRGPPKGLLLFGPPGTGKTLIGKCIASQSKSTFFSISASSLTSKWVGEGEKMVRALFAVAKVHQPAVIFIDEIDSLLSQRSDGEHEATRRIKTEFLVQMDGASTGEEDRILVVGATNRPREIDEAARRRFVKRLYIPLPETDARCQIITILMSKQKHELTEAQLISICEKSKGYSGADMTNLCREAALGPIRCLACADIEHMDADQVRPITYDDFMNALVQVRASVSDKDLDVYLEWNKLYGSGGQTC